MNGSSLPEAKTSRRKSETQISQLTTEYVIKIVETQSNNTWSLENSSEKIAILKFDPACIEIQQYSDEIEVSTLPEVCKNEFQINENRVEHEDKSASTNLDHKKYIHPQVDGLTKKVTNSHLTNESCNTVTPKSHQTSNSNDKFITSNYFPDFEKNLSRNVKEDLVKIDPAQAKVLKHGEKLDICIKKEKDNEDAGLRCVSKETPDLEACSEIKSKKPERSLVFEDNKISSSALELEHKRNKEIRPFGDKINLENTVIDRDPELVGKCNNISADKHKIATYKNTVEENSKFAFNKKRGRKRKWKTALGVSRFLKSCQFCGQQFSNNDMCTTHMKLGNCVSPYFCFICSKNLPDEKRLESHIIDHKQKSSNYISKEIECQDCKRTYKTNVGYMKHFREGTCDKTPSLDNKLLEDFPCDICSSRFSSIEYLKLHRYKIHECAEHHVCSECNKKFRSSQGLQRHQSSRLCSQLLKCHHCDKTYSYKAKESFKAHMMSHKSEAKELLFGCEECGKKYRTHNALVKHKLFHTGKKPYKCGVCGKGFPMRYMVKDHSRVHTGEKPYVCEICNATFGNKGHLNRHLRSHKNGTLFRRGRPKKTQSSCDTGKSDPALRMFQVTQNVQNFDRKSVHVLDGDMLGSQAPMIIQSDSNTIIITAKNWPCPPTNSVFVKNSTNTNK